MAIDDVERPAPPRVIVSGHDFYSAPRLAPDGRTLAWLAWRHPDMPWDGTGLYVAAIDSEGDLEVPRLVAGGHEESICQIGWSPGGDLYFVSDRDGWWRFYRATAATLSVAEGDPDLETVMRAPPEHAEFGWPQWTLGRNRWAFVDASTIIATFSKEGRCGLLRLNVHDGNWRELPILLEPLDDLVVAQGDAVFVGASPTQLPAVVRVSLDSGDHGRLRDASAVTLEQAWVSHAESFMFPTEHGREAHAFFYAPTNPEETAPHGERPPLIVIGHGGPTDAARSFLRPAIQFWTTRGFAVVDVDYGGSSGFGRAYRQRLNGQWGIVDVADCVNAARYLAGQGRVDPERLVIRGGSAGGYTALAALTTYPDVFRAAASYYGICDLEVLAQETHKFESRYTDRLIGPYPERQDLYRARSPIHAIDRLSCPLILFHGSEDAVVPPNQARLMASAVQSKGLPVALVIFEGEQHGFRRAASTIRALESELWFYGAVFGFQVADAIEPVEVMNLRPVPGRAETNDRQAR
jgi:dipeptidyl aminopeptidase/acylaminoacyl peptidase